MQTTYENIKVENKENSEVEITGEVTVEASAKFREKALKEVIKTIKVDGFRQGFVPEKVAVEKVGEAYILEEAAELALKEIVPEIIEKNAPNYVGRPAITITKLAPGNPIGFKIVIGVLPKITLPDYAKLAKAEMSKKDAPVEVSEKEVDDVIEEIRKQRAHHTYHNTPSADGHPSLEKEGKMQETRHDHSPEEVAKHMPEFNDEFVKTLGKFDSVADFRIKAKENMTKEKEHKNIEKKRGAMLEAIVSKTDLKLPQVIIESELDRMYAQFEGDISGMGLKVEDYLKHIKKTPEEIRKDWTSDAEKRAKLNLILGEIAKTEKLTPDKEAVDMEVKRITEQFKDVDPIRVRAYVEHQLTVEKVVQFLEKQ